jgi:hypothetical protein
VIVMGCEREAIIAHLDRLGKALVEVGLASVTRYESSLPLLRVFYLALPAAGESITVVPGKDADWFMSSGGKLLAPCTDLAGAVSEITVLMAPVWAAAARRAQTKGTW